MGRFRLSLVLLIPALQFVLLLGVDGAVHFVVSLQGLELRGEHNVPLGAGTVTALLERLQVHERNDSATRIYVHFHF